MGKVSGVNTLTPALSHQWRGRKGTLTPFARSISSWPAEADVARSRDRATTERFTLTHVRQTHGRPALARPFD
jgi:hypothetical protein